MHEAEWQAAVRHTEPPVNRQREAKINKQATSKVLTGACLYPPGLDSVTRLCDRLTRPARRFGGTAYRIPSRVTTVGGRAVCRVLSDSPLICDLVGDIRSRPVCWNDCSLAIIAVV